MKAQPSRVPLAGAVPRLIDAFVDAHLARPNLHRELLSAMDLLERRNFVDALLARTADRTTAALKARGAELDLDDPEAAAFVLVHSVHAAVHGAAEHRPELLERDRLRSAMVRLVFRYLGL